MRVLVHTNVVRMRSVCAIDYSVHVRPESEMKPGVASGHA